MADIFDEIDEDLKRDQMQVLWARYGKLVMAVAAAVILLVAARQGYTAWQSNQSEASATAYEQALKSDDIISALEAQRGQLTDGYAMLAQFQIAAAQAATNDFEAAEASYMGIAAESSVDPLYQQAATLLSVMVAPQDADLGLLRARLADLETDPGPWQAMALETGAGLALRSGDRDAAMNRYKRLVELVDIPAGMQQRADRMTAILSD
jgi:hypothetical protein